MSIFKKLFKAGGKLVNFVGKNVVKPGLAVASEFGVPGAGFVSSIVTKLIPDAPAPVQEQAILQIKEAAQAPAVSASSAIEQAAQLKQTMVGLGVESSAASSLGAVLKVSAEAPPQQSEKVLAITNSNLPTAPLANGFTKEDVKVLVNGALEGARNGAADAYLDKTEAGKDAKAAAIESQGQKLMPWAFLVLLGIFIYNAIKNKR